MLCRLILELYPYSEWPFPRYLAAVMVTIRSCSGKLALSDLLLYFLISSSAFPAGQGRAGGRLYLPLT